LKESDVLTTTNEYQFPLSENHTSQMYLRNQWIRKMRQLLASIL